MTINLVLGKTTQQIHVFLFLNSKSLKGFDDSLVHGMVLIDLQKVFDAINHEILLKKWTLLIFLITLLNDVNLIYQIVNLCEIQRIPFLKFQAMHCITTALQIRAGQRSITVNLPPLTAHIYHVMIIVTGGFSSKSFFFSLI